MRRRETNSHHTEDSLRLTEPSAGRRPSGYHTDVSYPFERQLWVFRIASKLHNGFALSVFLTVSLFCEHVSGTEGRRWMSPRFSSAFPVLLRLFFLLRFIPRFVSAAFLKEGSVYSVHPFAWFLRLLAISLKDGSAKDLWMIEQNKASTLYYSRSRFHNIVINSTRFKNEIRQPRILTVL